MNWSLTHSLIHSGQFPPTNNPVEIEGNKRSETNIYIYSDIFVIIYKAKDAVGILTLLYKSSSYVASRTEEEQRYASI